jgi:uncharacterized protein YndB with AHSA1/START domain
MASTSDRIEKQIALDAPRERVWRAITDVNAFNEWFGVALTSPFEPGAVVSGRITYPGYEHLVMTVWVETMERPRRFVFRWHPNAHDPGVDYSDEPTTLVTFTLEDAPNGGTRLNIVESGFDAVPESRRAAAFRSNSQGWEGQLENIRKHLAGVTTR